MNPKQKKMLYRILIAAALLVLIQLLPLTGLLEMVPVPMVLLYLIPYLVVGWDVLRKAVLGVKNRQPFDECFLMAVATVGAFALGEFAEGCAVILFYQIGELFQSVAVGKSRRSIAALMDIRPDYANLEQEDGSFEQVDPDEVEVGSVIVIEPGERVPIDGVIIEGVSTLNTAALTGESLPRDAKTGDEIISGCVNISGLLRVRTTKEFGESTVSRILDLVENSSMKKARAENFITRFARIYTPAVCYSALALAVLPPLVLLLLGQPAAFGDWVYRALTFLVISCPCALVISIPLSFFGGIGGASACGILVKGSTYLEELSRTGIVVFDKTGTLTQGVFEVTGRLSRRRRGRRRFAGNGSPGRELLQTPHLPEPEKSLRQGARSRPRRQRGGAGRLRHHRPGGRQGCGCGQRPPDGQTGPDRPRRPPSPAPWSMWPLTALMPGTS